jgi:aminopeptidase N
MRRRLVVVALTLALVAACGAPGVGDGYYPTYGNGGYNVRNYDLTLKYNPASDWLTGSAVISARASEQLAAFNLDLVGLTVRDITVDDARPAGPVAARFARDAHELTVVPSRPLPAGQDFVVRVRYGGVPSPAFGPFGANGVFPTDDGAIVLGQPESAAYWFPANDHPIDKASYTFRVRVPNSYEVVANGLPTGTTTSGGWTTHVWRAATPMASYLATFDIGQWNVNDRTTASGIRIIDAVDPSSAAVANPSLARQDEILAFLATQFGPYPFNAAGGIVDDHPGVSFALETQTRPVYGDIFFRTGQGDNVVVHELAHQWFGDSVSLSRWRDIWLNEGFATYAEWLWMEHEGLADAPAEMFESYLQFPADSFFWDLPIGNPGPNRLFDQAVYVRGAMTLQALRMRVGDDDFFQILQTWAATHKNGHGTTAKFIALSESISGRRLDGLFNNWLFAVNRPTIGVSAAALGAASTGAPAPAPEPAPAPQVPAWRDGFALRHALGQR